MRFLLVVNALLWIPSWCAIKTPRKTVQPQQFPVVDTVPTTSRMNRFLDKMFDNADINHDGTVSFAEAYEMVLKMYININRQAPIPYPSRQRVMQLFFDADTSHNDRLSRDEFKGLAKVLWQRALSRLVAHKCVTIIGAPLLATYLVSELAKREWPPQLAHWAVPSQFHEKVLPVITSKAFCRTVLLVALVSTLGNSVLAVVNWVLDMSLPNESEDPRLKRQIS